jgi:hypothetical protein
VSALLQSECRHTTLSARAEVTAICSRRHSGYIAHHNQPSQMLTWADAGETLNDIGRPADDAGKAIHAHLIRGNHARFAHDSNMCRKNVTEGAGRLRYSVSGAHMQANENSPLAGR